jgi:hypothetical protein
MLVMASVVSRWLGNAMKREATRKASACRPITCSVAASPTSATDSVHGSSSRASQDVITAPHQRTAADRSPNAVSIHAQRSSICIRPSENGAEHAMS